MTYTKRENIDAIILSLDFEKCFDKVSHKDLIGALEYFHFPQYIITWTEILYQQFDSVIQNNSYFTQNIPIEKGIRQGGPASSLYFLIVAETLARELRQHEDIQGIPVQDIVNLLGQFADDMDIYMLYDQKSLTTVLEILESFRLQSGFTVNYNKTQIYRIGSLRSSNAILYTQKPVSWTNETVKVLGINITHEEQQLMAANYDNLIVKTESILKSWNRRSLSLIGKINIVNTLVGSLFVHKMTVLPIIPAGTLKKMDSLIQRFLWNGARPKISLKALQTTKSAGGLKLVNLSYKEKSLKAAWIKNLSTDKQLANIAYACFCPIVKGLIWLCNIRKCDVKYVISRGENPFWHDVLVAWAEFMEQAE